MSITQAELVAKLRELVEEKGSDFLYQNPNGIPLGEQGGCLYVHHNSEEGESEPGCIAGHFFNRMGVPLDALEQVEGRSARFVAIEVAPQYGVVLDGEAVTALSRAQRVQDSGRPWSQSLEAAQADTQKTYLLAPDYAV